jgi:signal-transduction protein with cAMP-binding, CBS, and nucleotidyltransferase domain
VLNKGQTNKLISAMTVESYHAGNSIEIRGKQLGTILFIVVKGSVRLGQAFYEKFSVIGAEELTSKMSEDVFSDDLIAVDDSDIASITRELFEEVLGGGFVDVSHGLEAMSVLKKVELLKGLSNDKYHQLMQALKTRTYSENQIIVEQSEPGDMFFIVKEGTVDVFRDH